MRWRDSDHNEELINAVAEYLEIIENGGDPAEFLASLGPCALQVRQIAGIESLLRVNVAAPAPSEIARGRSSLLMSITAEERRRRQTGPKLLGMFAAAGLGLALGAGFASGAVPTEQLNSLRENLPFIGVEASRENPDGSKGEDEREFELNRPAQGASPQVDAQDGLSGDDSGPEATQPALNIDESGPGPKGEQGNGGGGTRLVPAGPPPGNGVGGTPPGQGGANPGNGAGGTPPGQGGENPGAGDDGGVGNDGTPPGQGGENPGGGDDNGVGNDGTPPGQGGDNPGNGDDNGVGGNGSPPGQGVDNPGNGVGNDGTPPGQGGDNPGNGSDNGVGNGGMPPGQGGTDPDNGVGNGGTPPGQGGANPGNGGGIGN